MFWVKKDSQKQMPKIDFPKKGENTYFKTHNRLKNGYFFNRRPIWEPRMFCLYIMLYSWPGRFIKYRLQSLVSAPIQLHSFSF